MPQDEKYIVFKRDEFNKCMNALMLEVDSSIPQDITKRQLHDAVVIRKHDVFAGPALHTYAAGITLAASMIEDEHTRRRLNKIAHYFHESAVDADSMISDGKLPD